MRLQYTRLIVTGFLGSLLCGGTLAAKAQDPENKPSHELVGGPWINTKQGQPLTLAARKGKVTLVHFWTYGCINCRRNLPAYNRLQKRFAAQDVQIIGVHTPETPGEKSAAHVARAVKQHDITYPVLVDGNSANWENWKQKYWPTVYLLDKQGNIRYHWEGELAYNGVDGEGEVARHIDELLKEK